MTYDIVIKDGKIIDGTGNVWYKSDVAVEKGKIAARPISEISYPQGQDLTRILFDFP